MAKRLGVVKCRSERTYAVDIGVNGITESGTPLVKFCAGHTKMRFRNRSVVGLNHSQTICVGGIECAVRLVRMEVA